MLNKTAKNLIAQGNALFSERATLDSLWQEQAENFYPQRADFTTSRYVGKDIAANLASSYPLIIARSFTDAISTFLRPKGQQWFKIITDDYEELDNDSRKWLEKATITMRRAMYDKESGFDKATKQVDADYAIFGQGVLEIKPNFKKVTIQHKCYHLRDCAWYENGDGLIDTIFIKRKPTALELKATFKDKIHAEVEKMLSGDNPNPHGIVNCYKIVIPNDDIQPTPNGLKHQKSYTAIYLDIDNQHILEEVAVDEFGYIIPRFQQVSGSQYAFSPATIAALPDARLIQAMSFTLLEAGQKAVNPPLIATQDAILNTPSLEGGAINYVDYAYDERLGEALRPMTLDKSGLSFGMELLQNKEQTIAQAFYLDKLNLPPIGGNMTATETTARISEYIRNALPLFQPLETEYNSAMCSLIFSVLARLGTFDPNVPDGLKNADGRGKEIKFVFENPLIEAEGKDKTQKFLEVKAALAEAVALDPSSANIVDIKVALRDVFNSIAPAKWLKSEEVVAEIENQQAQQQQSQQMIEQLGQGAAVAEQIGKAGLAINQAGLM
jgi:Bacteriophage head to tail connecting protein